MATKRIRRQYRAPFILDPSKLTRLLAVATERLTPGASKVFQKFRVQLSNDKVIETQSVEDVLKLDNSPRSQVQRLNLVCTGERTEVSVEFDAREPSVEVLATSDDAQVAADLMASAEEQVERTLQTGLPKRLASDSKRSSFSGWLGLVAGVAAPMTALVAVTLLGVSSPRPDYAKSLWLSDRDLEELRGVIEASSAVGAEQQGEITRRQLRNLIHAREDERRPSRALQLAKDWRAWLIAAPVLVIGVSLIYVLTACYPAAVFLWGDVQEWYERLLARRRAIWQVVVGATVIGIMANLFVYGLAGYMQK